MTSHPVRLLLADDSGVIRRLLTESLASDSEIKVVGAARHGGEALQLVMQLNPDVILLDVEMPVMDGVETVVEIRRRNLKTPIIMFSSITTRGGEATFDALTSGANDYITKPGSLGHAADALEYIRSELIPRVKLWGRRHQFQNAAANHPAQAVYGAIQSGSRRLMTTAAARPSNAVEDIDSTGIVAIGASTGGPNALAAVLGSLPCDFPAPIVVVQHMPPVFTRLMADRLNAVCSLHVREAIQGAVVEPGDVWIAPGNFHMTVKKHKGDRVLHLEQSEPEHSCRPAIDPLFRSVAATYGSRCLGVVLTGMGRDGESGSGAIRQAGGCILAQDQSSCVVWGMPRAVQQAGHADQILPLSQIAAGITEVIRSGAVRTGAKKTPVTN